MANDQPKKAKSRRSEIRAEVRKQRPAGPAKAAAGVLRDDKAVLCLAVAVSFAVIAAALLMLRPRVLPVRPGQATRAPLVARADFGVLDDQRLNQARADAAAGEPRVYRPAEVDPLERLRGELQALPNAVRGVEAEGLGELPPPLGGPAGGRVLDSAALTYLKSVAEGHDPQWDRSVDEYVDDLRGLNLTILPAEAEAEETGPVRLADGRVVRPSEVLVPPAQVPASAGGAMRDELEGRLSPAAADVFSLVMYPKVVQYTLATLGPTHVLDETATADAQAAAADRVPADRGRQDYRRGQLLLPAGQAVTEADYALLRAENAAYRRSLGGRAWFERAGLAGAAFLITAGLAWYAVRAQPKVAQNPVRAASLAVLLLACQLVAQLAGLGTGSTALLGVGPVLLAAMTLCVAYDGRFALGVGGLLALLVTFGLGEGVGFYLICFSGLITACFLLREVRSRSRLIEVGGVTAAVVGVAALDVGLMRMDTVTFTLTNAAYAALAALAAGGLVLCALPFIERTFRITTGLTLLEFQDHPLLRRMALEAPGTYNHSLQVANLSEEAANAIGADSLLCRVACYYHDVGKLRKPEYFIENQQSLDPDSPVPANPHLTLNPSMSLLVIIGHVKDGVAMAREWGLPRAFLPFIEEHHGTTLVEYFYREACQRQREKLEAEGREVSGDAPADVDYRYPGPRPRSRETAIVMLADCCESAVRAMADPTPTRIEGRVNDLVKKRLLDHQLDECPLTLGELERVRKSLVKSLVGVYHGRVPYPSDAERPSPAATVIGPPPQVAAG